MALVFHKSDTRGAANHGWLKSRHTFSFSEYYNLDRMGFGGVRVINDDMVHPSEGFGRHPHNNMEIISIPLAGGGAKQASGVIKEGANADILLVDGNSLKDTTVIGGNPKWFGAEPRSKGSRPCV